MMSAPPSTRACDWTEDGVTCERAAPEEVSVIVGSHTFSGDLCARHASDVVAYLQRVSTLSVGTVVDHKPRHAYQTATGLIVTIKEIRAAETARDPDTPASGMLPKLVIEAYLREH